MRITLGIDIGGSTTKIVGFRETESRLSLIQPNLVRAADPLTSVYGAFGKFIQLNGLTLGGVDRVMVTGVGSTQLGGKLYDLTCDKVPEFEAIGRGGLYLSGLDDAIVVSMGTGTAVIHATRGKPAEYLGGTGVGGGTLVGLSKLLLQMDSVEHIEELATTGDLSRIDLRIGDMMQGGHMPADMTAANFGNVSDLATRGDIALGLTNLVFETVGMVALFAARSFGIRNIVLTGNLTAHPCAAGMFRKLSDMFDAHFLIPDLARFGTVIGAALSGAEE